MPTQSPGVSGVAQINGTSIGNGAVVYSCSCTGQAGITPTDAAGNFTISAIATAIPATPSPTYTTVPGRNYTIVAKAPPGAEAWTLEFLGKTPAHNIGLGSGYAFSTDLYASAAALYVFWVSANTGNANTSYDQWNMYSIAQWAQYLRNTPTASLSAPEQQFLSDISAAQGTNSTLFPLMPLWYPGTAPAPNKTIKTDIVNIRTAGGTATDPVPTPCPGGVGQCTGTPVP